MSESKKVTFDMLGDTVHDSEAKAIVIDSESGFEIQVKRYIGFEETVAFVRSVADSCFDEDGQYVPELFDFAAAINMLVYYCGFEEPGDYSKAYRAITQSDIIRLILSEIDHEQYNGMVEAAKNRIAHRCNELIQTNAVKINTLLGAIEKMMDDSTDVVRALDSGEFRRAIEVLTSGMPGMDGEAQKAGDDDSIVQFKPRG